MKVYLLYRIIDVIPEVVGVYTSYELADDQLVSGLQYIVETYVNVEPDELLRRA